MSRLRAAKPSAPAAGGRSPLAKRLQTGALFATLLLVAVLVGSMARGVDWGGGGAAPAPSAVDGRASGPVAEPPEGRVRVEVLNASGRTGLARQAGLHLREQGFDVLGWGNAPVRRGSGDTTLVLDHGSRPGAAREVAGALRTGRIVAERDSAGHVDVTVLLGRDWRPEGAPDSAAAVPARPAP